MHFAMQMPQASNLRLIFCPKTMVTKSKSDALVLIDGYNLYHSLEKMERVEGAKVKWFDVRKLKRQGCPGK